MITRGPKGLQLEVRAQWAPGLLHSRWSLLLLFVCMYIACKASVAWRALVIRCDTVAEWKWKRGQWCCLTKSGGSYHIELLSELIKAGKRKTWTRTSPAFNPHCEAGVSRPRTWNGYFWYPNTTNQSIIQHWFIVKKQTLSTLRTNPSSRPPMRRNPQDLSSSTIALTTRGAINIWTIVLLNVTLIMLMLRVDFYFYVNGSDGNGSNDNDGNPKLAIS